MSITVPRQPAAADVGARRDALDGVRDMLPVIAAYAPLGLVVGGHVAASDNPVGAWLGTWVIYGGAAQLAVLDVLAHEPGWVAAAVVGVLVNLRLAAYATAMVPDWQHASLRRRVAAAVILTDAPWALARARTRGRQTYYLGASVALLVIWPALVTAGMFVGDVVDGIALTSLLMPLTLGAVIVPQLRQRAAAVAMAMAVLCALLTLHLSAGLALALIGLAGGLAGMAWERVS
ncbi:MAG: AzlC family ABC transporter permease [Marmoricola sp.]